ncbi:adenylate/guanylate cyclase domain-containing protein [Hoeflea sp. TYP-13]|uniref:adenylate/guanylate cyclase domain-containing protein n=1 Tax=Hoeflea sp. TYP-13 TaxID=3230023 RepID=UPI0034C6BD8F
MSDQPSRRLAAIMAADIVGYSRLMSEDEAHTLAQLRTFRSELLEPAVLDQGGRIIKNMGDGWLAEFGSAAAAVACATDIQNRLTRDGSMQIRIGIHIGDIIHEDADIFGDGVNIAARLQQLAIPGAVLVSGEVHRIIDSKLGTLFKDLGTHKLKNIAADTTVFGWAPEAVDGQSLLSAEPLGRKQTGVPVILIEELQVSGSKNEASELAEEFRYELLLMLSRRIGIKVVGERNEQTAPKYVLGGRCRVSGDRVRLDIVMSAGTGGGNIWTERFEDSTDASDDFVEQVARRAAGYLRTHTNYFDGADVSDLPDSELSVEELLSKAAYLNTHWNLESVELARASLTAAIEKSPDNPTATAMLTLGHISPIFTGHGRLADVDKAMVMDLANRAVSLGPNSDFVFMARANCRLWLLRDFEGAKSDAERSLKINPDYQDAQVILALVQIFSGEPKRGAERLVGLMDLMSESMLFPIILFTIGLAYLLAGEKDKALDYAREGYERAPSLPNSGIVFSAAAADDPDIAGSSGFTDMIDRLNLNLALIDNFPFSRKTDTELLNSRLRAAGVPH